MQQEGRLLQCKHRTECQDSTERSHTCIHISLWISEPQFPYSTRPAVPTITLNLHLVTTTNFKVWSFPKISSLHKISSCGQKTGRNISHRVSFDLRPWTPEIQLLLTTEGLPYTNTADTLSFWWQRVYLVLVLALSRSLFAARFKKLNVSAKPSFSLSHIHSASNTPFSWRGNKDGTVYLTGPPSLSAADQRNRRFLFSVHKSLFVLIKRTAWKPLRLLLRIKHWYSSEAVWIYIGQSILTVTSAKGWMWGLLLHCHSTTYWLGEG